MFPKCSRRRAPSKSINPRSHQYENKWGMYGVAVLRAGIRDQILTTLRAFRKRETVEQIGLGQGMRRKFATGEPGF